MIVEFTAIKIVTLFLVELVIVGFTAYIAFFLGLDKGYRDGMEDFLVESHENHKYMVSRLKLLPEDTRSGKYFRMHEPIIVSYFDEMKFEIIDGEED